MSYNATATLIEVIVLSDGGSIIRSQNGTWEMLGIKQPPCDMRNPISTPFLSSKDSCASSRHTDIYTSILNTLLYKENINHGNRSFLSG